MRGFVVDFARLKEIRWSSSRNLDLERVGVSEFRRFRSFYAQLGVTEAAMNDVPVDGDQRGNDDERPEVLKDEQRLTGETYKWSLDLTVRKVSSKQFKPTCIR